jgi:serine/threonine protein kinase/tetratricopeptide (TPR) repeat protein
VEKTRQWEQVKELFEACLECPPERRDEFLDHACVENPTLRLEVASLISAYGHSDALSVHPWTGEFLEEGEPDKVIGQYRLIRKIGEGGMGQVWLAEQSEPLKREVALKLIHGGIFDPALLRRFQAERQSLAAMDHPAIAKVFDAGATAAGQPYFVMEYVPGEPITTYCDARKLTVQQRLELFIRVCDGVQHAHQKAVIHRDLKPANILVVEVDGRPMPRLIDFGLAKALRQFADNANSATRAEGVVGTPGYMSPEQIGSGDIDTRTDVYSLGVVLYELLTGQLPFDADKLKQLPLFEILRITQEQEPVRPSLRVGQNTSSARCGAEKRQSDPKRLVKQLRGDLDWITMKALEKDRTRRYGTPTDLSRDIRRYLDDVPVEAGPGKVGYRVRKYVRRHRFGLAVTALLSMLLPTFAILQAIELHRIARERDRAGRITAFMTEMFKVSNPSEERGNQVTAREILDKASTNIKKGLAQDPETQAQMMMVMGKVYDNLGLYAQADSLEREATSIRRSSLGAESPETAASMLELAWTLDHEGRYPEAEKLQRDVLDFQKRKLDAENLDTVTTMADLAVTLTYEGRYSEAETLQRQALDLRRRLLKPDDPNIAASLENLGTVLQNEAHYAEAEKLDKEAIAIRTRAFGPDHPDTIATENNLANVLYFEGRYPEAEKLDQQVIDERRKVFGPENPLTLKTMSNLANVLHREHREAEAETMCRETLEIQKRVLGPEHPETLMSMNNLTAILSKEGKYAEAEQIGTEVLEMRRRVLGPEHPLTLRAMSNLSDSLTKLGNWSDAEKLLRQALAIQRRVLGPDHPDTALSTYNLACVIAHQGKTTQALAMLREAVDHGLAAWVVREMSKDPDLNVLHNDSRFKDLVAYANDRVTISEKK